MVSWPKVVWGWGNCSCGVTHSYGINPNHFGGVVVCELNRDRVFSFPNEVGVANGLGFAEGAS